MRFGLLTVFALALLSLFLVAPALADTQSATPPDPAGCAEHGTGVRIECSTDWGVVPFPVHFSITSGGENPARVWWDFESDGSIDTTGITVVHTFTEPVDYMTTATIRFPGGEVATRSVRVSGYKGVLTLTFDDGSSTVYEEALPLFESKNVTATAYIVPTWLEQPEYMTWDQLRGLQAAGWDIGSHSMTHARLTEISSDSLSKELSLSKAILEENGFSVKHFAVPYSAYNDTVIDSVKQYYKSCRLGDYSLNHLPPVLDSYLLKSYCSQSYRLFSYYQRHIDSTAQGGLWYILNNHVVMDSCSGMWCVETSMLSEIIDYAREKRVKVANIDEVLTNPAWGSRIKPRHLASSNFVQSKRVDSWSATHEGSKSSILHKGLGESIIILSLPGTMSAEVVDYAKIYDVMGRLVCTIVPAKGENNSLEIDFSSLRIRGYPISPGIYFCRVEASGRSKVFRLALVR